MLRGRMCVGLLGSCRRVVRISCFRGKKRTYKSEQNISIAFATAFENRTVRQTLVKTAFLHSEFGIRAGRPRRSRRFSHRMNIGIRATLTSSKAMFAGLLMFETALVNVLHFVSRVQQLGQRETDART
jgi:hypothetical protein